MSVKIKTHGSRLFVGTMALACSACAAKGSWYYQNDGVAGSLYVATRYSGMTRSLKSVEVYSGERTWKCNREDGPLHVEDGQLIVLSLLSGASNACKVMLPSGATFTFSTGSPWKVDIAGALPSSLPDEWLHCSQSVSAQTVPTDAHAERTSAHPGFVCIRDPEAES